MKNSSKNLQHDNCGKYFHKDSGRLIDHSTTNVCKSIVEAIKILSRPRKVLFYALLWAVIKYLPNILAAANAMFGVLECSQCELWSVNYLLGERELKAVTSLPPSSHGKLTCDWLRFSGFNSSSISEIFGGFLGLPRLSSRMMSSLSVSSWWS